MLTFTADQIARAAGVTTSSAHRLGDRLGAPRIGAGGSVTDRQHRPFTLGQWITARLLRECQQPGGDRTRHWIADVLVAQAPARLDEQLARWLVVQHGEIHLVDEQHELTRMLCDPANAGATTVVFDLARALADCPNPPPLNRG